MHSSPGLGCMNFLVWAATFFSADAFVTCNRIHQSNFICKQNQSKILDGMVLFEKGEQDEESSHESSLIMELEERVRDLRVASLETTFNQPPNPNLSASEFVERVLHGLKDPDHPFPDSGIRLLLRSSTSDWRNQLYKSIAAPLETREDLAATSLGNALSRPGNQFGILVRSDEPYRIDFPSDVLDFGDGSCWLECRLRHRKNDTLLVVMGWELIQRPGDGAWLCDRIDWQDFRDIFRPGIGREEWDRVCG